MEPIGEKVRALREAAGIKTHPELAALVSRLHGRRVPAQSIQQLESGGVSQPRYLIALARAFGLTVEDLHAKSVAELLSASKPLPLSYVPLRDANPTRYRIAEASESDIGMPIAFIDALGSCGGGAINWDAENRAPLIKEPSWFKRYNIKPEETIAVWADGDSMSNFIVDGDIVIFNRRKVEPKSGLIYLLEHPDGLRIKRLRREIDGSWVLESDNQDKRRYPDERITPDQADLLKIVGEFVYRQGG